MSPKPPRARLEGARTMSKPETWMQEGPLDNGGWEISVAPDKHGHARADITFHDDNPVDGRILTLCSFDAPSLRDFARALDRAADALEEA